VVIDMACASARRSPATLKVASSPMYSPSVFSRTTTMSTFS
jgi:hypothetical protein